MKELINSLKRIYAMMKKSILLSTLVTMLPLLAQADTQKSVYEKWESPTPWLHDRFGDFLDCMPHHAIAVEVGVQGGGYAAFMLRKTNPQKLFLIDCWEHQDPQVYDDPEANVSNELQERLYRETKQRFANDPRVVIMREYSKNAAAKFEDESIDWLYLDANHGYEAAREDLDLWWPKIKKGGMLSGHDYAVRPSFGVVQAVNEFLIKHNLSLTYRTVEEHIYDSWAIRKP
jgi:hypothetical protein